MHRICYGFYRSIMNWSKLGQKTDFWAHFVSHFVLQNFEIFKMERTKRLWFWSILGPHLLPGNQKFC